MVGGCPPTNLHLPTMSYIGSSERLPTPFQPPASYSHINQPQFLNRGVSPDLVGNQTTFGGAPHPPTRGWLIWGQLATRGGSQPPTASSPALPSHAAQLALARKGQSACHGQASKPRGGGGGLQHGGFPYASLSKATPKGYPGFHWEFGCCVNSQLCPKYNCMLDAGPCFANIQNARLVQQRFQITQLLILETY